MKNSPKKLSIVTVVALTLAPLVMTACASDEPRSVSTTERTVTKFDDGSTRSSSTTHTEVRE